MEHTTEKVRFLERALERANLRVKQEENKSRFLKRALLVLVTFSALIPIFLFVWFANGCPNEHQPPCQACPTPAPCALPVLPPQCSETISEAGSPDASLVHTEQIVALETDSSSVAKNSTSLTLMEHLSLWSPIIQFFLLIYILLLLLEGLSNLSRPILKDKVTMVDKENRSESEATAKVSERMQRLKEKLKRHENELQLLNMDNEYKDKLKASAELSERMQKHVKKIERLERKFKVQDDQLRVSSLRLYQPRRAPKTRKIIVREKIEEKSMDEELSAPHVDEPKYAFEGIQKTLDDFFPPKADQ